MPWRLEFWLGTVRGTKPCCRIATFFSLLIPLLGLSLAACSSKVIKAPAHWPETTLDAYHPLTLQLPSDFWVERKIGKDYIVFYIRPPNDLSYSMDGNLGIYAGYTPQPFCDEDAGSESAVIGPWTGDWAVCKDSQGRTLREAFPTNGFVQRVHVFLVGDHPALVDTLSLIARSLHPAN